MQSRACLPVPVCALARWLKLPCLPVQPLRARLSCRRRRRRQHKCCQHGRRPTTSIPGLTKVKFLHSVGLVLAALRLLLFHSQLTFYSSRTGLLLEDHRWKERFVFPRCTNYLAIINAWYRATHTVPSIQAMDKSFKPGEWRSKAHNGARDEFARIHAFICAVEKYAATLEGPFEDRVSGLEARFEAHRVALAPYTTSGELTRVRGVQKSVRHGEKLDS